jgi:hypothetical protein
MADDPVDTQSCLPVPPKAAEGSSPPSDLTSPKPAVASVDSDDPAFFAWTEDRYFELYLAQRKGFSESRKESFLRFDQTIITLAIGAVAVSVAFLEKQAVPKGALQILFGSWAMCIVAVIAILVSMLASSKADGAQIKSLDECMRTGQPDESAAKKWNSWVYRFNWLGILCCVLGIIGLVAFGVVTLERKGESSMATEKKEPQKPPAKPPERKDIHEERQKGRDIPLTKIDRAAPADDLAGPFNRVKKP